MPTATADWIPAAPVNRLVPGDAVDVWWLDLAEPRYADAALHGQLLPGEAAEIARFHRAEDRRQRAAARLFLRYVLGTFYLSCDARDVRWTRDAHGRPRLADTTLDDFDFNLSHAGPHVLLAVSPDGRIGVDVETHHPLDAHSLARLCATDTERRWLATDGDPGELTARFLRLWTMKEAVLKCRGLGLSCDPRSCEVTPPLERARLAVPGEPAQIYRLASLPMPAGAFGALAWPGETPRSVRHRQLPTQWLAA